MDYLFRRLRPRARLSGSVTLIALLLTVPALAQQPHTPPVEVAVHSPAKSRPVTAKEAPEKGASLDQLLTTITQLEARIRELEGKLAHTTPAPVKEVTHVPREVSKTEPTKADEPKADEPKPDEPSKGNGFLKFFQETEVSGFVDAYFGYNFNRPSGDAQLRNFDTKHNQFAFNLGEIALEKKPTETSRVGFRMDLGFGPTAEMVHAAEPGGSSVYRHLQQGYISYLAPVGNGLQVDFGKFVTPHGAEVIETKDNWNYSRSLLFALAIPYYHFGVRATYPINDKVSIAGYIVNGWNNVVDNNQRKSFGLQAIIKPTTKLTFTQNYMAGPEQTLNNTDWRQLWDTTVAYAISPTVSLMANYDYGFDRVAGTRVRWQGLAAYARIQANDWLAFAPRFEIYDDHDGFTTGTKQVLKGITLTSEQRIKGGLLTRFEYRHDLSDEPYFFRPVNRLVQRQGTVTFGLVYAFSSKAE